MVSQYLLQQGECFQWREQLSSSVGDGGAQCPDLQTDFVNKYADLRDVRPFPQRMESGLRVRYGEV